MPKSYMHDTYVSIEGKISTVFLAFSSSISDRFREYFLALAFSISD
jgi:hypothetical protein